MPLLFFQRFIWLALTFLLTGSGLRAVAQAEVYAITDVQVLPMTTKGDILQHATVIIKDNKIVSLNGPVPDHAEIIDGKGKWLMPGLMDMHVHVPVDGHFNATYPTRVATVFTSTQDVMTPFVANGVTTIFDLRSEAGHFGQRNEILRGDVIGPRMALAAMINGGKGDGRIANNPADGRQSVRMARAEGYEFIKVYSQLDRATYTAIADEAGRQGMKVVGHIPNAFRGHTDEAFVPHFDLVAHAEECYKQAEANGLSPEYLAGLARANGTWLIPTLGIIVAAADQGRSLEGLKAMPALPYVHPLLQSKWLTANNYHKNASPESIARLEKMIGWNKQLVKACKDAGVPMVAGTDAGSSGVVWGFSLHDELELMVAAGLTPEEALRSATCLPAAWLGIDSLVGTVVPGHLADLVLLDANPLQDIRNTRKIAGVFVNGRWLSKTQIEHMLNQLREHNEAIKDRYEWRNRSEY